MVTPGLGQTDPEQRNIHRPTGQSGELDRTHSPRPGIKAAPCEGCLRTLVEGINPFVVRPGVEILKTCFPCVNLGISEDARILAKRQILGSRNMVFDTMPRDVRDQCAGFRERPRFNHGFRGCNDYFDLRFSYRCRPKFHVSFST
ncbi:hypothetical protein YC2023_108938 [Brassica napus]